MKANKSLLYIYMKKVFEDFCSSLQNPDQTKCLFCISNPDLIRCRYLHALYHGLMLILVCCSSVKIFSTLNLVGYCYKN